MTVTAIRPDHRTIAAHRLVTLLDQQQPQAEHHWATNTAHIDGYPAGGGNNNRTNDNTSTVERAILRRDRWTRELIKIRDWRKVIHTTTCDVVDTVTRHANNEHIPMTNALAPLENVAWTLPRLTLTSEDREDIYAGITLIAAAAHQALNACQRLAGPPEPRPGVECSGGTGREGAWLPYVPHSRDPENGWADPSCRQLVADYAPLCDACALREQRWRRRNRLPDRRFQQSA